MLYFALQSCGVGREVLGWGGLSHQICHCPSNAPSVVSSLTDLPAQLKQLACAERCMLALTKAGKVYSVGYSADAQVKTKCTAWATAPMLR